MKRVFFTGGSGKAGRHDELRQRNCHLAMM